ncbi:hypothetical protein DVH24_039035 [Malus domestica]|uniref:Uncharacterized protein n=1 Tax=Malus domestica TaxID=3750 RepID=A0A498KBF1_MALDO|nr:hypothetical protein DVH24_039035 [Malus domestica]
MASSSSNFAELELYLAVKRTSSPPLRHSPSVISSTIPSVIFLMGFGSWVRIQIRSEPFSQIFPNPHVGYNRYSLEDLLKVLNEMLGRGMKKMTKIRL